MTSRRNWSMCAERRQRLRHLPDRDCGIRGRRPYRDLCAPRCRGWGEGDHPVVRQRHDAAGRPTEVMMRDPMTDRPIGEAEVREKFGVGPDKVIEVQALCGDSTDNVPGVPGIGVKTAAELINTYGDLESLLARASEIKQPKRREALIENEAKARLSKELVKLDDDVPLPCPLSALIVKPYDPEKLFPFLDEMELRALKGAHRTAASIAAEAVPVERAGADCPGNPALYGIAHLCPRRHARGSRPLDRSRAAGGDGCGLAGGERRSRHPSGARRDRARHRAGPLRLCPARPSGSRDPRPRRNWRVVAADGHRPVAAAVRRSRGPQDRP